MVQVLNTTGLNYQLEKTITEAEERIILISPYLKLSNRIKELIEDKNRLKVDIRIVYGKSELNALVFVKTSMQNYMPMKINVLCAV